MAVGSGLELPRSAVLLAVVPARVEALAILVEKPDVVVIGEVVLARRPELVGLVARHGSRTFTRHARLIYTPQRVLTSAHGFPRKLGARAWTTTKVLLGGRGPSESKCSLQVDYACTRK